MSIAHQFIAFTDNVYKKYVKTQIGSLSGKRADPTDIHKTMPFVLSTPDSHIKFRTIKQDDVEYFEVEGHIPEIDYENEVLETYSSEEDKIFRAYNKKLLEQGLLVEYTAAAKTIDLTNALTQEDILQLAQIKNIPSFKKEIRFITSAVTLERIRDALIDLDRPMSFLKAIKERIDELTNNAIT
jgi:hypothetical protein